MVDDSQLVETLIATGIDRAVISQGRKKQNGPYTLYETLLNEKLVDERSLVNAASSLLKVPSIKLSNVAVDDELAELIPQSMAVRNRVFPIEIRGRALVLAMVDPIDLLALDEISSHTGYPIQTMITGPQDLALAIEKLYTGIKPDSEFSFDNISEFEMEHIDEDISEGSWGDFFGDEQRPSDEISQEMRDRPSTDVLLVDEIDEIDDGIDVLLDFDEPIGSDLNIDQIPPLDELANWDVDDAITDSKDPSGLGGASSFIVSADNAGDLYGKSSLETESDIRNGMTSLGFGFSGAPISSVFPTAKSIPKEMFVRTSTAMNQIPAETKKPVGKSADTDAVTGVKKAKTKGKTLGTLRDKKRSLLERLKSPSVEHSDKTDYGALGRAILKSKKIKSKTEKEKEEKSEKTPPKLKQTPGRARMLTPIPPPPARSGKKEQLVDPKKVEKKEVETPKVEPKKDPPPPPHVSSDFDPATREISTGTLQSIGRGMGQEISTLEEETSSHESDREKVERIASLMRAEKKPKPSISETNILGAGIGPILEKYSERRILVALIDHLIDTGAITEDGLLDVLTEDD